MVKFVEALQVLEACFQVTELTRSQVSPSKASLLGADLEASEASIRSRRVLLTQTPKFEFKILGGLTPCSFLAYVSTPHSSTDKGAIRKSKVGEHSPYPMCGGPTTAVTLPEIMGHETSFSHNGN